MTSPTNAPALDTVLDELAARWPRLTADIEDVRVAAHQLDRDAPRAAAYRQLAGDGLRSPNLSGGGASKGSHSDPTGETVVATSGNWPTTHEPSDRAAATLRIAALALTRLTDEDDQAVVRLRLRIIAEDLRAGLGRIHRTLPLRETTLARIRADDAGDPGCASCRRGTDSRDRPIFNPTDRNSRGACGLCRWCYQYAADKATSADVTDRAAATDEQWWPPVKVVEAHNRGERITVQRLARLEADDRAARRKREDKRKRKVRAKTRYRR